jgi:hypothetical protein
MEIQAIELEKTAGILYKGQSVISKINVYFYYNPLLDKFTAIAFDKYKASGIFHEGITRDQPQEYVVGRFLSSYIRSNNLIK